MQLLSFLLSACAVSMAKGIPLCKEEGLWGTAWCLAAETAWLGHDTAAYFLVTMLPPKWQSFWELVPSLKLPPIFMALQSSLSRRLTPIFTAARSSLTSKISQSTIWRSMSSHTSKAVVEKHRAGFVASYPKHAALMQAGDVIGLLAVVAWVAIACTLTWYAWQTFRKWRRRSEVMFFPDKSGKNVARICREIAAARRRVWLAMFAFTDDMLSEAIVCARERGVDVRVIVDDEQCQMQGAEATWLVNSGVPVTTDKSGARMHHKFVVLDNTVLSGSFNWTRQASIANNENLCVLQDRAMVKAFAQEFLGLWYKFNDRGGRLHHKRARRRCQTPPPLHTHTHGGG